MTSRAALALLAKIAKRNELNLLSMGMSADFPLAIARCDSRAFGTAISGSGLTGAGQPEMNYN